MTIAPLTDADADARVDAGRDWLDANAPRDWRTLIDPDRLDLEDACDCICGQVYEDASTGSGYLYALRLAGETHDTLAAPLWSTERGFAPREQVEGEPFDDYYARSRREWLALDAAWRRLLFPSSEGS